MKQRLQSLDEYANSQKLLESKINKVNGSKIKSYWSEDGDDITWGFTYNGIVEENEESVEDWSDEFDGSISNADKYRKELAMHVVMGFQNLKYSSVSEKDKFVKSVTGGLFGAETYHGWDIASLEDNYPNAANPLEEALNSTIHYIIAKCECYFDRHSKL